MGSGSDLIARQLADGLEKELGVAVTVLNIDGADGVFAHSAVAFGARDGYTLGLVTPDFIRAYWLKQTDYSYESFTPIARVEQSPAVFWVRQDNPWHNLKDALTAIRKAPAGTYSMSGMAPGGAYHIAIASLLKANGIRPDALRPVPSDGAQPGFEALANGDVDICPDSLREGTILMKQGRIRPLAVLSRERLNAFAEVPTAREASGKASFGGTWRAVLAPDGLPPEITTRLTEAVVKVADSSEFRTFLEFQGFSPGTLAGENLRKLMAEDHRNWGSVMGELGLRKRK